MYDEHEVEESLEWIKNIKEKYEDVEKSTSDASENDNNLANTIRVVKRERPKVAEPEIVEEENTEEVKPEIGTRIVKRRIVSAEQAEKLKQAQMERMDKNPVLLTSEQIKAQEQAAAEAAKKAEEARRLAAQRAMDAEEARRKAEEAMRAEREAKAEAERVRLEAERQRKEAEERARQAAEAERRRAEEEARLRAEAERRRAEEEARLRAEEEKKRQEEARKAEEERQIKLAEIKARQEYEAKVRAEKEAKEEAERQRLLAQSRAKAEAEEREAKERLESEAAEREKSEAQRQAKLEEARANALKAAENRANVETKVLGKTTVPPASADSDDDIINLDETNFVTIPDDEEKKDKAIITEDDGDVKTINITIKFDMGNVKKGVSKVKNAVSGFVKNHVMPEERTLEDSKKAMEENEEEKKNKILREVYGDDYEKYKEKLKKDSLKYQDEDRFKTGPLTNFSVFADSEGGVIDGESSEGGITEGAEPDEGNALEEELPVTDASGVEPVVPEITVAPENTYTPEIQSIPENPYEPEIQSTPENPYEPEIQSTPENPYEPEIQSTPENPYEPEIQSTPENTYEPEIQSTPENTYEPEIQSTPENTYEPEILSAPENTYESNIPTTSDDTYEPEISEVYNPAPVTKDSDTGLVYKAKGALLKAKGFIVSKFDKNAKEPFDSYEVTTDEEGQKIVKAYDRDGNLIEDEEVLARARQRMKEDANLKSKRKTMRKYLVSDFLILGACSLVAILLAWVFLHFVAGQTTISGSSMEPTISDGNSIIINNLAYRSHGPKRFDVIVFESGAASTAGDSANGTHLIKRVVGLPGDKLQIKEGSVYINGEKLKDDLYGNAKMESAGIAEEEITIGDNMYFVLGDNRNMSIDSRNEYVGLISGKKIVGKAVFCISPVEDFGSIK